MSGQNLMYFMTVETPRESGEVKFFEQKEQVILSQQGQIKLTEMLLNPPELPQAMENLLNEYIASQQNI